jgi:MFS family permease
MLRPHVFYFFLDTNISPQQDRTIIATAIPTITDDFHALNDVGWYGSAYMLTSCAFQLFFGKVYTFYNTKWVFLSAIIIFEVGSVLCGAAPSSIVGPCYCWDGIRWHIFWCHRGYGCFGSLAPTSSISRRIWWCLWLSISAWSFDGWCIHDTCYMEMV